MVSTTIKIIAVPTKDKWTRYIGYSIDEPLDTTFWNSQKNKIIGLTSGSFTKTLSIDLQEGTHTIYVSVSTASPYYWTVEVLVNGSSLGKKIVDRYNQYSATFSVGGQLPEEKEEQPYVVNKPPEEQEIKRNIKIGLVASGKGSWSVLIDGTQKYTYNSNEQSIELPKGLHILVVWSESFSFRNLSIWNLETKTHIGTVPLTPVPYIIVVNASKSTTILDTVLAYSSLIAPLVITSGYLAYSMYNKRKEPQLINISLNQILPNLAKIFNPNKIWEML